MQVSADIEPPSATAVRGLLLDDHESGIALHLFRGEGVLLLSLRDQCAPYLREFQGPCRKGKPAGNGRERGQQNYDNRALLSVAWKRGPVVRGLR